MSELRGEVCLFSGVLEDVLLVNVRGQAMRASCNQAPITKHVLLLLGWSTVRTAFVIF